MSQFCVGIAFLEFCSAVKVKTISFDAFMFVATLQLAVIYRHHIKDILFTVVVKVV